MFVSGLGRKMDKCLYQFAKKKVAFLTNSFEKFQSWKVKGFLREYIPNMEPENHPTEKRNIVFQTFFF